MEQSPPKDFFRSGRFEPYQLKDSESYMNANQQKHFREVLKSWRKWLMLEVGRTVQSLQAESNQFPDVTDKATQIENLSVELRTRDRERKLIHKIDHAITLIDQDAYGYCDLCSKEIGIRRLEVRPTATLCFDCKTVEESKEQHFND